MIYFAFFNLSEKVTFIINEGYKNETIFRPMEYN